MDLELNGKIAIITGGSKGIGKAIAQELGQEGVRLVIAARSKDVLEQSAKDLESSTGQSVLTVQADTTKWSDVQNIADQAINTFGKIDILINSAAMVGGQVRGNIDEAQETDLIEDLDTKVVGYFRAIKAVVPHMRKQKWGRIISIGGVSARQSSIYGLRNAAVMHMTKTLSDQLGPDGITLNVIHPGSTRTELIQERLQERAKAQGISIEDLIKQNSQNVAIRRIIDAKELGYLTAFLCSPKAECVTGESISASGGSIGSVFQ
ncbi:MAG: short-chain dehydrogenase [Chloroflexi bacterium]|nr:short-chain dehydrogenase [Chloroflexota bacterium]|tara:strand:+ start:4916 stop:5707 length:792 start_codon:yes stop_codon:yes gene_type:complete